MKIKLEDNSKEEEITFKLVPMITGGVKIVSINSVGLELNEIAIFPDKKLIQIFSFSAMDKERGWKIRNEAINIEVEDEE